jgi:hypothetical protein
MRGEADLDDDADCEVVCEVTLVPIENVLNGAIDEANAFVADEESGDASL